MGQKEEGEKKDLISFVRLFLYTHIHNNVYICTIYFILQQTAVVSWHTDITRLGARGGRPVLKTVRCTQYYACVRASAKGGRGGDGCRCRRPSSSKGSRKYYYLSEIDRKSSSCGSLVFFVFVLSL